MNTKLPYLPDNVEIKYVEESDTFLSQAKHCRNNESTDYIQKTGAVIVKDGVVIGSGANQSSLRNKLLMKLHQKGFCIRRILKIKTGEKYWLCPGCSKSYHHAETRAVRDGISKGHDLNGSVLYLYGHWWCCKPCWDSMLNSGIHTVYLVTDADKQFKR